ncbi:Sec-independent protein translocase protein TatC [Rhizocola hellebori]|uniref:Sec-independent protein translocase protein TatC n=2 Tax=Rhizocola hellebori TaxID=1392758 RepID=A0A8J3QAW9_9ACTN|nr:Sec-independent protein translocase protein TatC [Rhizocola hellebori]
MTLIEHIRELRDRLFKASLAVAAGLVLGWIMSRWAFEQLEVPYCELMTKEHLLINDRCQFLQMGAADGLMLRMKLALWLALIVAAPVWLYQLWAFIAPGLHRHERKWAYTFTAIAAPLFGLGVTLGFIMASNGLEVLMDLGVLGATMLEVTKYVSFMTGMMLLFGVSFEFPLLLLMLNFAGVVSGKKMLGWWRVAVFISFAFAAVTTPDPGPFGMTVFALCLSLLYFIAVGVALLNDKRKGRGKEIYAGLDDDETSSIDDYQPEPVEAGARVEPIAPLERRYDDMT